MTRSERFKIASEGINATNECYSSSSRHPKSDPRRFHNRPCQTVTAKDARSRPCVELFKFSNRTGPQSSGHLEPPSIGQFAEEHEGWIAAQEFRPPIGRWKIGHRTATPTSESHHRSCSSFTGGPQGSCKYPLMWYVGISGYRSCPLAPRAAPPAPPPPPPPPPACPFSRSSSPFLSCPPLRSARPRRAGRGRVPPTATPRPP